VYIDEWQNNFMNGGAKNMIYLDYF